VTFIRNVRSFVRTAISHSNLPPSVRLVARATLTLSCSFVRTIICSYQSLLDSPVYRLYNCLSVGLLVPRLTTSFVRPSAQHVVLCLRPISLHSTVCLVRLRYPSSAQHVLCFRPISMHSTICLVRLHYPSSAQHVLCFRSISLHLTFRLVRLRCYPSCLRGLKDLLYTNRQKKLPGFKGELILMSRGECSYLIQKELTKTRFVRDTASKRGQRT
jgi:hypothetical protein